MENATLPKREEELRCNFCGKPRTQVQLLLTGAHVVANATFLQVQKPSDPDKVVARIRREPDPFIEQIVAGWPRKFAAKRAVELGFKPDRSFEDIIRIHIEDELAGRIA